MGTWRNINTISGFEGRLFLGTLDAAISPRTLSDRRITHIVSLGTDPIPADNPASGFHHLRIPVEDVNHADLLIHLPEACQFIHEALNSNGIVLVHCVQGLSRSAAVVAAYLMYAKRIKAVDAIEEVRRSREQIWINPGFHEQLVLFELCRYAPSDKEGIYVSWRRRIERGLKEQGSD
ncbi:phosphatases II [Laetiporus sulphureus 93-53]|uniref:Phosphatases II n=1 Tax=Laetiporus sulphureus 93-53 TaxID=1314785 RepID=A0A165IG49_9APHY|nr:phosphatases II [Laetiporus sulphureus 93-53]KZT13025.1 phosphatases II [Laetiporus sulphureus 93-53]